MIGPVHPEVDGSCNVVAETTSSERCVDAVAPCHAGEASNDDGRHQRTHRARPQERARGV